MKLIATSDWHIGNMFHGSDRLPEHRHFLGWLLSQIKEQQPDALLIAGDVFDNGNPSAAAQSSYYKFLADATSVCPNIQIIITAGNHDSASRLEAPRYLLTNLNVEVRGTVKRQWIVDGDGQGSWKTDYDDLIIPVGDDIVVLAVPYLRSDVVQNQSYSAGVNDFLRALTTRARELYPDKCLVMMAHMYAKGAEILSKDASEKIVIGGQEEVNMEGWTDHPDYFTCGHIHKRQHIWGTDWARYTGSVLPMSFAEKNYEHSVDLITIEKEKRPNVKHLVYVPQHKLIEIPENDESLTPNKLAKLISEKLDDRVDGKLDDNFVYLTLKVTQEKVKHDDIKNLEDLIAKKNAVLCKTKNIVESIDIKTIDGTKAIKSVDDILNRDPMETLKETFRAKFDKEFSESQNAMLHNLLEDIKKVVND